MTFYRGSGSSGKTQKHKITGQPRSGFSFTDGMGEGPEADKLKFNVIQMGRNKIESAVVDRLGAQKRGTEMVVRNWFPAFTISVHAF